MLYCKDIVISDSVGNIDDSKINNCVNELTARNVGLSVVDIQILNVQQTVHAFIFYRHSKVADL